MFILAPATNLSEPSVEKGKPQKRKLASGGESSVVQSKRRRKNEDTIEEKEQYVQDDCACVYTLFMMVVSYQSSGV